MTTFFISLFFVFSNSDAKVLLAKTLNNYTHAKGLEVSYSMNSSAKTENDKASYFISGDNCYFEDNTYVTLVNDDYYISVQKSVKKIVITKRQAQKTALPVDEFAKLSKNIESYKVEALEQGNIVRIKLLNKVGILENVCYEINKTTGTLLKMEYSLNTSDGKRNKTIVNYTHTDFNKKFAKGFFSEKKLVKKTAKGFVVNNELYKGYRIIDLTK